MRDKIKKFLYILLLVFSVIIAPQKKLFVMADQISLGGYGWAYKLVNPNYTGEIISTEYNGGDRENLKLYYIFSFYDEVNEEVKKFLCSTFTDWGVSDYITTTGIGNDESGAFMMRDNREGFYIISRVHLTNRDFAEPNAWQEVTIAEVISYYTELSVINTSSIFENGYQEGVLYVLNNLSEYNLYTAEQYAQNYENGVQAVLNYPSIYGLYTQQQYDSKSGTPLTSVFQFLTELVTGLAPILEIELFGFLPIGLILAIPIVFSIFKFILGLFR